MAALEKKIINDSKRIVIKVGSGLIRGNNTALVNENFLNRIKMRFGEKAVKNITEMSKIKLKRKIIEDNKTI